MTVTAKKRKYNAKADVENVVETVETFGQKYHCDACSKDVTHQVRIRCAVCPDFDLCVECFSAGTELKDHSKTHSYRVIEALNFPIFEPDWGADEEILLVEGLEIYGIGNYDQISEHVGSKNKIECFEHYERVYVSSESFPYPEMIAKPDQDGERKRARPIDFVPKKLGKFPRPPASQPANHDILGFMPGRGDFELECDMEAEQVIKDMEFFESDPSDEVELKCALLNNYNAVLDKRLERKQFVFDRHLVDFKRVQSTERKRTKEERDAYHQMRVFAKLLTASDFELFMDGILAELKLRKEVQTLQEYHRMGIKTLEDANVYEKDKLARLSDRSRGVLPNTKAPRSVDANGIPYNGTIPLDIGKTESVSLLSDSEKQLCSTTRVFPAAYLAIKDIVLNEYESRGSFSKTDARALLRIDSQKASQIYDYFVEMGWISL